MDLDLDWSHLLSTAGGGGIALALCKALITKTFNDIKNITEKLNEVLLSLSAINVKLGEIDKINDVIHKHDRAISKIEARLDYDKTRLCHLHQGSMPPL